MPFVIKMFLFVQSQTGVQDYPCFILDMEFRIFVSPFESINENNRNSKCIIVQQVQKLGSLKYFFAWNASQILFFLSFFLWLNLWRLSLDQLLQICPWSLRVVPMKDMVIPINIAKLKQTVNNSQHVSLQVSTHDWLQITKRNQLKKDQAIKQAPPKKETTTTLQNIIMTNTQIKHNVKYIYKYMYDIIIRCIFVHCEISELIQ